MFCPECGAEIPDDSKHCKECGANLNENAQKEVKTEKKGLRSKIDKKMALGCCIGIIIIFGLVVLLGGNSNHNTHADDNMSEADFKSNCTAIDYDVLNKNANNHTGEKLKFTGKIIQIQEDNNGGKIRLATDGSYSNVVYVEYKGTNNFVENDQVTVYGYCDGAYTYTSTIGAQITLPKIDAKYIDKA